MSAPSSDTAKSVATDGVREAIPPSPEGGLLEAVTAPAGAVVLVFRMPSLSLVTMNEAAISRLMQDADVPWGELALADFIGVSFSERQAEMVAHASVLGRWQAECNLRDVWGSEFPMTVRVMMIADRPGFLFLEASETTVTSSKKKTFSDRQLLRALMENLPDSIYFKDRLSRFIRVSRAMANKFGLRHPHEAISKTDFDFFTSEHAAAAYNAEQAMLRTLEPIIDVEEKETWDDGRITWVSSTKLPLFDSAGVLIGSVGISHDITARKKAEEERRQMETQLQLAYKLESIGRLAAGVAHEINTPTQFITDNVHFLIASFEQIQRVLAAHAKLRRQAEDIPALRETAGQAAEAVKVAEVDYLAEEIPRTLQQTLEGLDRVARIVRSLKEFSHPNSPKLTPNDLNHAIEVAVAVSRHEWKYVAELRTEFAEGLPLVPCVLDEFNQVMINLIINAAHTIGEALKKHGRESGLIIIRTRAEADYAVVEVVDDGMGIPDGIKDRIFEPFFTTKELGKGSGQGLAIVHTVVVNKHHGSIEVDSEPDHGTTFRLRLPLTMTPITPTEVSA